MVSPLMAIILGMATSQLPATTNAAQHYCWPSSDMPVFMSDAQLGPGMTIKSVATSERQDKILIGGSLKKPALFGVTTAQATTPFTLWYTPDVALSLENQFCFTLYPSFTHGSATEELTMVDKVDFQNSFEQCSGALADYWAVSLKPSSTDVGTLILSYSQNLSDLQVTSKASVIPSTCGSRALLVTNQECDGANHQYKLLALMDTCGDSKNLKLYRDVDGFSPKVYEYSNNGAVTLDIFLLAHNQKKDVLYDWMIGQANGGTQIAVSLFNDAGADFQFFEYSAFPDYHGTITPVIAEAMFEYDSVVVLFESNEVGKFSAATFKKGLECTIVALQSTLTVPIEILGIHGTSTSGRMVSIVLKAGPQVYLIRYDASNQDVKGFDKITLVSNVDVTNTRFNLLPSQESINYLHVMATYTQTNNQDPASMIVGWYGLDNKIVFTKTSQNQGCVGVQSIVGLNNEFGFEFIPSQKTNLQQQIIGASTASQAMNYRLEDEVDGTQTCPNNIFDLNPCNQEIILQPPSDQTYSLGAEEILVQQILPTSSDIECLDNLLIKGTETTADAYGDPINLGFFTAVEPPTKTIQTYSLFSQCSAVGSGSATDQPGIYTVNFNGSYIKNPNIIPDPNPSIYNTLYKDVSWTVTYAPCTKNPYLFDDNIDGSLLTINVDFGTSYDISANELSNVGNGDCPYNIILKDDSGAAIDDTNTLFSFQAPIFSACGASTPFSLSVLGSTDLSHIGQHTLTIILESQQTYQDTQQIEKQFIVNIVDQCVNNGIYSMQPKSLYPINYALGEETIRKNFSKSMTSFNQDNCGDIMISIQSYGFVAFSEYRFNRDINDPIFPITAGLFYDIFTDDFQFIGQHTLQFTAYYLNRPEYRILYKQDVIISGGSCDQLVETQEDPNSMHLTYYVNDPEQRSKFIVRYKYDQVVNYCGKPKVTLSSTQCDKYIKLTEESSYENFVTVYLEDIDTFQNLRCDVQFTWYSEFEPDSVYQGFIAIEIINPCIDVLSQPSVEELFQYTIGQPKEYFSIESFAKDASQVSIDKCGDLEYQMTTQGTSRSSFTLQEPSNIQDDITVEVYTKDLSLSGTQVIILSTWFSNAPIFSETITFKIELINPCDSLSLMPTQAIESPQHYDATGESREILTIEWQDFEVITNTGSNQDNSLCSPIVYDVALNSQINISYESWFKINPDQKIITMTIKQSVNVPSMDIQVTVRAGIIDLTGNYPRTQQQFIIKISGKELEVLQQDKEDPKQKKEEKVKQNFLRTWISEINQTGEVVIVFSSNIEIPEQFKNIEEKRAKGEFDEDLIKDYLKLEVYTTREINQTLLEIENFELVYFQPQSIKLQVLFDQPRQISTQETEKEQLFVKFKKLDQLSGEFQQEKIHKNDELISFEIPKQVTVEYAQRIDGTIQNVQQASVIFGSSSLIMNILMAASLKQLWNMINIAQFLIFVQVWQLSFPYHTLQVLKTVKNILLLEFIDFNSISKEIMGKDAAQDDNLEQTEDEEFDEEANQQRRLQDIQAMSSEELREAEQPQTFFDDLGVMLFVAVGLAIIIAFIYALRICMYMHYSIYKGVKFIERKIFWNSIIRYTLQSQVKLLFQACVCLVVWNWNDAAKSVSNVVCIIIIVGFIFLPILYVQILRKHSYEQLRKPSTKSKIGSLYLGIRSDSKMHLSYSIVFLIRRLIFTLITFTMFQQPNIQVQVFIYSIIIYGIYFYESQPYEDKLSNTIEKINEIMLCLIYYHFIFFSGLINDVDFVDTVGWSAVIWIGLLILINFGVLFIGVFKKCVRKCKFFKLAREKKIAIYKRKQQFYAKIKDKIEEIKQKNDEERQFQRQKIENLKLESIQEQSENQEDDGPESLLDDKHMEEDSSFSSEIRESNESFEEEKENNNSQIPDPYADVLQTRKEQIEHDVKVEEWNKQNAAKSQINLLFGIDDTKTKQAEEENKNHDTNKSELPLSAVETIKKLTSSLLEDDKQNKEHFKDAYENVQLPPIQAPASAQSQMQMVSYTTPKASKMDNAKQESFQQRLNETLKHLLFDKNAETNQHLESP